MIARRWAWLPVLLVALASCSQATPAPVFPKLPYDVFDTPIEITGGFGDHRNTHFHAGLDLATGGVVGRAVHAPIDGDIVRVRASGVGYGRSLYLETADGRLLVFGHLDAFAEPIASYVYAVQDSSGQYEQDLWPARGRFRVRGGEVIGWTGRSGTGTPHLHVEVRRGDMAINPLLAGYTVVDTTTPRIESVTLLTRDRECTIDDIRYDIPSAATREFGAADTVRFRAHGRFRLIVEALDGTTAGAYEVAPWRLRVHDGDSWIDCEFDSVSWATDMSQSDFVYDSGRATKRGSTSIVLAAPVGGRPRVIATSGQFTATGGDILLNESDRVLEIEARDLAGHVTRKYVALEHGRFGFGRRTPPVREYARVDSAVLALPGRGYVNVPAGGLFEAAPLTLVPEAEAKASGELVPISGAMATGPWTIPLALPARIGMRSDVRAGHARAVGLYRRAEEGWEYVGNQRMSKAITGTTRHLGTFALFRDTRAPRVAMRAPAPRGAASAYSRWALEVSLAEQGSGVDSRATYFTVDGRRVPSEWDDVVSTLRWKPPAPPARGSHKFSVIAVDHAGNTRKVDGRFVVR